MKKHKNKRKQLHKKEKNHEGLRKANIPSHKVMPHQKLYMFMAVAVLLLFSFVALSYIREGFGEREIYGFAAVDAVTRDVDTQWSLNNPGVSPKPGQEFSQEGTTYVRRGSTWVAEGTKAARPAPTAKPAPRAEPKPKKKKKKKAAPPAPPAPVPAVAAARAPPPTTPQGVPVSFGVDKESGEEIKFEINAQGTVYRVDSDGSRNQVDDAKATILRDMPNFKRAQAAAAQPAPEPEPVGPSPPALATRDPTLGEGTSAIEASDGDTLLAEGRAGIAGRRAEARALGRSSGDVPAPEQPDASDVSAFYQKKHGDTSTRVLQRLLDSGNANEFEATAINKILTERAVASAEPLRGGASRPGAVPAPDTSGESLPGPGGPILGTEDGRSTASLGSRTPTVPEGGAREPAPRRVVAIAVGPAGQGSARTTCSQRNGGAICQPRVVGGKLYYAPVGEDVGREVVKVEPLPGGGYPDVPEPRIGDAGDASADIGSVRGSAELRAESRAVASTGEREPGVPPAPAQRFAGVHDSSIRDDGTRRGVWVAQEQGIAKDTTEGAASHIVIKRADDGELVAGVRGPGGVYYTTDGRSLGVSPGDKIMSENTKLGSAAGRKTLRDKLAEAKRATLPDTAVAVAAPTAEKPVVATAVDKRNADIAFTRFAEARRSCAATRAPEACVSSKYRQAKEELCSGSAGCESLYDRSVREDSPDGRDLPDDVAVAVGAKNPVDDTGEGIKDLALPGGEAERIATKLGGRDVTVVGDRILDAEGRDITDTLPASTRALVISSTVGRAERLAAAADAEPTIPEDAIRMTFGDGTTPVHVTPDGKIFNEDGEDITDKVKELPADAYNRIVAAAEKEREFNRAVAEGEEVTFDEEDFEGAAGEREAAPASGSAGDAAAAATTFANAFKPRKPVKSQNAAEIKGALTCDDKGACKIGAVEGYKKIDENTYTTPAGTKLHLEKDGGVTERDENGNVQAFTDKGGNKHDFGGMGVNEVERNDDGSLKSINFDRPERCSSLLIVSLCKGGDSTATLQPDGSYKLESGARLVPDESGMVMVTNEDGSISLLNPSPGGLQEAINLPSGMNVKRSTDGSFSVKDKEGNTRTITLSDSGHADITTTDKDGTVVARSRFDPKLGMQVSEERDSETGGLVKHCGGRKCGVSLGCNENGACTTTANFCAPNSPAGQCQPCQDLSKVAAGGVCELRNEKGERISSEEACKDSNMKKADCIAQLEESQRKEFSFNNLMADISTSQQMAADARSFCDLVGDKRDCDSIFGDWFGVGETLKELQRSDPMLAALFTGNWEESICWDILDRSNAEAGEEGFFYDVDGTLKFWIAAEKAPYSVPTERDRLHKQGAWYYRITGELSPSQVCQIDNPPPDEPSKKEVEDAFKNEFLEFSFHLVGAESTVIDTDKNPETPNHFRLRCDEGGVSMISSQTLVRILPKNYAEVCIKFHNPSNLQEYIRKELDGNMFCNTIMPSDPEISEVPPPQGGTGQEEGAETATGSHNPGFAN